MSNKVFWGIIIALIGGFVLFTAVGDKSNKPTRDSIGAIPGVRENVKQDNKHVQGTVNYPDSPPMGGNHNPVWAGCDQKVYDMPLQTENAVHSLEHGAIWITYTAALEKSQVDLLKAKVASAPATFMSPFPQQKSPLVLTSWGRQLELTDAKDSRIDQFITKYRKSADAPEPGATCASPQSGM